MLVHGKPIGVWNVWWHNPLICSPKSPLTLFISIIPILNSCHIQFYYDIEKGEYFLKGFITIRKLLCGNWFRKLFPWQWSLPLSFSSERVKSSWNRHWTTNRRPQWLFKHFMIAIPVWNIHSAHKTDPDASIAVFKAVSTDKLPPFPMKRIFP